MCITYAKENTQATYTPNVNDKFFIHFRRQILFCLINQSTYYTSVLWGGRQTHKLILHYSFKRQVI